MRHQRCATGGLVLGLVIVLVGMPSIGEPQTTTLVSVSSAGVQANRQGLLEDADLPQVLQGVPGHAARKIDRAVLVEQLNATDIAALQSHLVGDRADDVARGRAVITADLNSVTFELGFVRARRT